MQVTYMDHMGSDLTVVNAARVSFDKESDWAEECTCKSLSYTHVHGNACYEKKLQDKDTKLINYLAEHHHWLPFRHPTVMFRCKAPIFVARQAVKHQVGMSWSEVSRRYVNTPPEFYTPEVWRKRADDKKQGSSDAVVSEYRYTSGDGKSWWDTTPQEEYEDCVDLCQSVYLKMMKEGVAPEMARMVLPQSMYTEWVWTGTLLSWAHFVKQRTEGSSQKEIQEFAKMFVPHLEKLYPVSWTALMREYTP